MRDFYFFLTSSLKHFHFLKSIILTTDAVLADNVLDRVDQQKQSKSRDTIPLKNNFFKRKLADDGNV